MFLSIPSLIPSAAHSVRLVTLLGPYETWVQSSSGSVKDSPALVVGAMVAIQGSTGLFVIPYS